jgi:RNA polymerase primary sigma factor
MVGTLRKDPNIPSRVPMLKFSPPVRPVPPSTMLDLSCPASPVSDAPPSLLHEREPTAVEPYAPERSGLQLYLQEIGKTPLLTVAEEVTLARRIRRGDKAARDQMIKANLRLVVRIALSYKDFGLPLLDLISEGNLGLVKAVERFDPRKGGKLSTYGAWWIKQSMRRALANQSKIIRLPVHLLEKISRMRRAAMALADELGREPSVEELAMELGLSAEKVAHLKSVSVHPTSLDAPISAEGGSSTFGEIVADENAISPFENVRERNLRSDLTSMLDSLEKREADILRMRFGLDCHDTLTLEELGAKFKVTRERVRQVQNLALKKIRKLMVRNEAQRSREDIELDEFHAACAAGGR